MELTPVNTSISPALDPDTYRLMDGYDDNTKGYVDDVVSLMNDVYQTLGKLGEARKAADANPGWNDDQKLLIVGKEAAKQKDRLARRLDTTLGALDNRIVQVEAELAHPIQLGAATGPIAAEVRAHVKSLKDPARTKLIREALEADDEPTLHAVLGAQPFLSGMSEIDREYFTSSYHAKKNPGLVARLDLMKRVRTQMHATGASGAVFHDAFIRVTGAHPSRVRAIDEANQAALDSLKIGPAA